MRKPKKTAAQRRYDREQRAVLTLRRAAVRYAMVVDPLTFAELVIACEGLRGAMGERASRKLAGKLPTPGFPLEDPAQEKLPF